MKTYYYPLFFLVCCLFSPVQAATPLELVKALQGGGHIIYMRHARTDLSQNDKADMKLDNCPSQRNLSEEGREQAKAIGAAFKRLNIPVEEVLSSPFCRCMDTAQLVFGKFEIKRALYFAAGISDKHRAFQSFDLVKLLSSPPQPASSNRVLVSHTANLKEATGIWPKPEGVMHIFKPLDAAHGKYEHLGHILPDEWATLVQQPEQD